MVLEILKMVIAIIYNELNQKYVFNRVAWVILVAGTILVTTTNFLKTVF